VIPLRAIAFLFVAVAVAAAGDVDPEGRPGIVAEIVDGDTVILDDGREVRLVGIQAPKLPLGRAGFVAWPLAEEAKRALAELVLGKPVRLVFTGRRVDRHGRWLAHLHGEDGLWAQGEMLERGLARIYTFADNAAPIADMLSRERAARAARRGIWADPFYAIRTPDNVAGHIGGFELVEGRVVDAAIVRGRAYLNFGADYKTDFTVTVAPADRRRFEAAGIDLAALAGRTVRARGWIESYNGPMIEATHPDQLEIFD
jgi:endonuclease YncB( thermonuclease family)